MPWAWFRDAVASTMKLHLPGKGQPSEAALAKEMLRDVLAWFPDRTFVLLGDGAYSTKNLLGDLDERVTHVGVMRSDAAIYDPVPPPQPASERGRKPSKGPRLASPKQAMKHADRNRSGTGPWAWERVEATAYGVTRRLQVLSFQAVWPKVLGLRPILVVLVRDPQGKFKDTYLFTTDLTAELSWVIVAYSRRWSIEVAFKASKQVMKIEAPQHGCRGSIEKLSPWVWLMQSVIALWYMTEGRKLPPAFRRVGHGMVACSYAPRTPRSRPRPNNYHHVGHQSRPGAITHPPGKLR